MLESLIRLAQGKLILKLCNYTSRINSPFRVKCILLFAGSFYFNLMLVIASEVVCRGQYEVAY